jgi:hypothetical protein
MEDLIDGRHLLVGRCVQHDDGGPKKTQRTPDAAQVTELFVKKKGR